MLVFISLFLAFLAHSSSDPSEFGVKKLGELLKKANEDTLISIEGDDFSRYISKGPRPYWSFIILTAVTGGKCTPCEDVRPAYKELAEIIQSQRPPQEEISSDTSDTKSLELFIMEVDYISNQHTFQQLGLSTAPMLVLVPPTKTRKQLSLTKFFKQLGAKYQYPLSNGRGAEEIGEWLNKVTSKEFSFGQAFELPDIKIIIAGLVGGVTALIFGRKIIDRLRKSFILYAIVSMAAYGFIIGGGMFNFIRQTPWAHVEKGQTSYFSHMSRYQFQSEGYIVGTVNVLTGLCAFFYINSQRHGIENDEINSQGGPSTSNGNGTKKLFYKWWTKLIPPYIPLILIFIGNYALLSIYTYKNGHYNYGHVGLTG